MFGIFPSRGVWRRPGLHPVDLRFWRVDVPSGMIPLVWNGMMSFGGAWFFLAASESISVLNHTYALPGVGCTARRCAPAPGTCSSSARSAPW